MTRIVCISDTHNKLSEVVKDLPSGDMIIHAGDFTAGGTIPEVTQFLEEYTSLEKYKYKIFIAGNHDRLFEKDPGLAKQLVDQYKDKGLIYLQDSSVEIDGLKIWGAPWSLEYHNWAFGLNHYKLERFWDRIPDDADVVVVHGPPWGIGDYVEPSFYHPSGGGHQGDQKLREALFKRVRPKLTVFGHIHEGNSVKRYDNSSMIFVNASSLDERYQYKNKPKVIELD